jgi:hypothetical protein
MSLINIDTEHLTLDQVAILLGVSIKSVDNYTKYAIDPMPYSKLPDKKIGKSYNWIEVLNWWIKRENKKLEKSFKFTPADELAQAKLDNINKQNQKLQLEIDEKEGTLLNAAEVEKVWSNTLLDIKNSLLNVGHTASGSITANMNYNKKKELIDTLIFDALDGVINKVSNDADNDNDIVETE